MEDLHEFLGKGDSGNADDSDLPFGSSEGGMHGGSTGTVGPAPAKYEKLAAVRAIKFLEGDVVGDVVDFFGRRRHICS